MNTCSSLDRLDLPPSFLWLNSVASPSPLLSQLMVCTDYFIHDPSLMRLLPPPSLARPAPPGRPSKSSRFIFINPTDDDEQSDYPIPRAFSFSFHSKEFQFNFNHKVFLRCDSRLSFPLILRFWMDFYGYSI